MLLGERYLEDCDARFIVQFDAEKFVVGVYGKADLFVIDREQPDAVNSFKCASGAQVNLSLTLLPMFNYLNFPFAFVLSQSQIILADLRRLQAFEIAAWKFRGAPACNNQMEMFLSVEPGFAAEGINLLALEFDGSNTCVRRLFFSPDFVQAMRFLGQD